MKYTIGTGKIEWTKVGGGWVGAVGGVLTYEITPDRELLHYGGRRVIKQVNSAELVPDLKNFAEAHLTDQHIRRHDG